MPRKVRTAPRKTPRQARSRATVDAILAATARVVVKHGFDRATTNEIAEAAGVSVGSLYQYFPSKEALVAALLERHQQTMRALITDGLAAARALPLAEAVRAIIDLMIKAHAVDPGLHRVLKEQVPRTGRHDRRYDFERAMLAMIAAYLAERRAELAIEDVELSTFIVVASVEAITHGVVLYEPERLRDARLVDELTAMVVGYLTAPRAAAAITPPALRRAAG
jgi:AcrR family transcriptional regulator